MGYQEVQKLHSTLSYGNVGENLTQEMQESCREVAAELRLIGDSLETTNFKTRGINSCTRIVIGVTLLGIVTNILLRNVAGFFYRQ